jgi:hypothetical protein
MKKKLKGLHFADVAEIQEAATDELKKVEKEEFSAGFQKVYDSAKAYIYGNGVYFEYKKVCLNYVPWSFKEKVSPNPFVPHCVCTNSLKYSNSTFCSHSCIYVFCVDLRTNSDYWLIQH